MIGRRSIISLGMVLAGVFLAAFLFRTYETRSSARPMLVGVNLPSATFAEQKLPGAAGADYFYPDDTDIAYFTDNGMNVVRLGFLWERLQPALDRPLDHDEARRLDDAVQAIAQREASVILDLHNYGRYRGQVVGSPSVPATSFADLWARLAAIYKGNDHVIFGLMNEPHDLGAGAWQQAAQAAIFRIRQAGARNRILVSSTQWDGASHFLADGDVWKRIADPADNFAFEVHEYVDADGTGTHPDCPSASAGIAAMRSVTQWMRQNGDKVFLGEFGASDRPACLTALERMLSFMQQQSDVWLGWTYFAGGRGWATNDTLSIQPVSNADRPQMVVLKRYLR